MNKVIINSYGHQYEVYVRDDADASVVAEIFKEHEYRVAEEVIRSARAPIIDGGAHSGLFSLFARSLNSKVKIIAVEPEANNLNYLRKHLEQNKIENVEIVEGALSGKGGKRLLNLAPDSHNHHLLAASEVKTKKSVEVETFSLSELLKKCIIKDVSLLKLDIEGGEHEIFDTLGPEELGRIHAVVMEYHTTPSRSFKQIEAKLRENGFGVQVFPSRFDKKMGFLFAINKRG